MLVAEMASYHKLSGRTLLDALDAIYEKFGCFYNHVTSTAFAGLGRHEEDGRTDGTAFSPRRPSAWARILSRVTATTGPGFG